MESSELRIGNYVMIDNPSSWPDLKDLAMVVTGVNNHMDKYDLELFPDSDGKVNLQSKYETYGQFSQFIEPININEDWLLKFGFQKKSWFSEGIVTECFDYEKNGIVVYLIASGFEIEIKHREDQFNLFKVWQYVHELQNIYWILKKEELIVEN